MQTKRAPMYAVVNGERFRVIPKAYQCVATCVDGKRCTKRTTTFGFCSVHRPETIDTNGIAIRSGETTVVVANGIGIQSGGTYINNFI